MQCYEKQFEFIARECDGALSSMRSIDFLNVVRLSVICQSDGLAGLG